jgi:4-hydroxybenzoate polyprenyltransferase
LSKSEVPLYIDLDGTLVATDLFWEGLVACARRNPLAVAQALPQIFSGRAAFKGAIGRIAPLDVGSLPYRDAVLLMIRDARACGRRVVLATAADRAPAEAVAKHLGLFDAVLASDGSVNLKGSAKLEAIRIDAGGPFDYVGDSMADRPILAAAQQGIFVGSPASARMRAAVRLMRPQQWAKNLLVFVPSIVAHEIAQPRIAQSSVEAFVAFCLCASGTYAIKDVFDVEVDRTHPTKSRRPVAAGQLEFFHALLLGTVLLSAGVLLSAVALPPLFVALLGGYVATTLAYSLWLKRVALVDVLTSAALYGFRVIGGALAASVPVSPWLLGFAGFLFLSLAFVECYAELGLWRALGKMPAGGLGYTLDDVSLVGSFGTASAYLAVLVLALYVGSPGVRQLYTRPESLWLLSPLMLFWISRVWLLAHRGQLRGDDPLVFALRDPVSYAVGVGLALVLLGAGPT